MVGERLVAGDAGEVHIFNRMTERPMANVVEQSGHDE